jgi:hypothetical protein
MTDQIFARARGGPTGGFNDDEGDDNADPFSAIARLIADLQARVTTLEDRRVVDIKDAKIDGGGHLILEFSDGRFSDVGKVTGRDAPPAPAPQSLVFERDGDGRIISSKLT